MDGCYGVIWNVEVQMKGLSRSGLADLKAGGFRWVWYGVLHEIVAAHYSQIFKISNGIVEFFWTCECCE